MCTVSSRLIFLILCGPLLVSRAALVPADLLPPVATWHGESEALVAKRNDRWATPAEQTGLTDSPGYDETVRYLKQLAGASRLLSLQEFGRSAQDRPLYVVIASKTRTFSPEAIRSAKKPTLLVQAGIHSGEIDGKDAGLMLLRDIVRGTKAKLLDNVTFLFVPIFNVDGHERSSAWNRPNQRGPLNQGWRTTAQNLNLNRDYVKADAPEMQAMLRLLNQYVPTLYLDLHVTDGADYQYDITYGYNGDMGGTAWSPHISAWLNATYRPAMDAALKRAGHFPGPLVSNRDERDLTKGLNTGTFLPRFSHGYGDLRHLPTVLVENHSLKTYRQRVLGTYVLLEATLRTLSIHAAELQKAIAADQAARPMLLPINSGRTTGTVNQSTIEFLGVAYTNYTSSASGTVETRWLGTPKVYSGLPVFVERPGIKLKRPKAYWVPVSKPDVIQRLKLHGLRLETLPVQRTISIEMYRLVDPQPLRGERGHPYEGRHTLQAQVQAERRIETFPAGSVRVPTDQPLGDLAMALLEPESNDSFFAWGFFLETLQRTEYVEGYVIAPLAEQMLSENPKLKAEFETKLAADPKFAADPTARLQWFYARSKFYDERYLLYPVGVER